MGLWGAGFAGLQNRPSFSALLCRHTGISSPFYKTTQRIRTSLPFLKHENQDSASSLVGWPGFGSASPPTDFTGTPASDFTVSLTQRGVFFPTQQDVRVLLLVVRCPQVFPHGVLDLWAVEWITAILVCLQSLCVPCRLPQTTMPTTAWLGSTIAA
jgi:hypothetical protein